jgi:hypothetical protein
MSKSDKIAYKIEGLEDVSDRLKELSLSVQNRIIKQASTVAMEPALAEAKARCPKDTGALAASLSLKRVKSRGRYKKGMFVLSLGSVKDGYNLSRDGGKTYSKPFKYGVPVEYGHVMANGQFKPPAAFLRNTYFNQREAIVERFAKALREISSAESIKLLKKKFREAGLS